MSVQNINDLCSELTTILGDCLASGRINEALSVICNVKYDQCLKDKSWDIIPSITKFLVQETVDNSPEVFDCCETLLKEIAEKSNPEEALLEFLEQAESFENDVKFLALLKPIQIILLKLPKRRRQSLEWCLNMIESHVASLPVPGNYSLEGEERKLLDSDPCVRRITKVYKGIVPFFKPFVNEVSLRQRAEYQTNVQRDLLICYILQFLGRPLAFLDLECYEESSSAIRSVTEELLTFLTYLVGDLMIFLEYAETRESERRSKRNENFIIGDGDEDIFCREDKVSVLSIAVLYYLILAERIQLIEAPRVYSSLYIFQRGLYLTVVLMKRSEELVIRKGLSLVNAVLVTLSEGSVPWNILESPIHKEFVESLSKVMVCCEVESWRKSAVLVLRSYLFKFDAKGRYLLILNLPTVVNHSGILGYLITLLKDMIISALSSTMTLPYFTGKTLWDVISKYCLLKHGAETDLVENVDQIVSALNLIRFLALHDRENKTGIWDYVGIVEKSLLEPLREGIILSRAHYKLKLRDLEEEKKNGVVNNDGLTTKSNVTITVGGQLLPDLTHENKVTVIMSALNSIDLMDSLLSRVNECINSGTLRSSFM